MLPGGPATSTDGEAARDQLPVPGGEGRLGGGQGKDAAREPFFSLEQPPVQKEELPVISCLYQVVKEG